jgi:hypothetical protein
MEPYSSDDIKRKKRKNNNFLNKYLGAIPEITSALIVSTEGFPIAYRLPQDVDETRIAAMTSALFSLSERAILEQNKGDLDQLYIKGSEGYFLVMQAGPNAIMAVSTTKDVRLGLILLDCRRTCEKIAKLISNGYDGDDGDRYPYPYIFKPPDSSGDLRVETQVQVRKHIINNTEDEFNCQYCGRKLTDEERVSHNCRKRPY